MHFSPSGQSWEYGSQLPDPSKGDGDAQRSPPLGTSHAGSTVPVVELPSLPLELDPSVVPGEDADVSLPSVAATDDSVVADESLPADSAVAVLSPSPVLDVVAAPLPAVVPQPPTKPNETMTQSNDARDMLGPIAACGPVDDARHGESETT